MFSLVDHYYTHNFIPTPIYQCSPVESWVVLTLQQRMVFTSQWCGTTTKKKKKRIFLIVLQLAHVSHVQAAPLDELFEPLLLFSKRRDFCCQPLPLVERSLYLQQATAPVCERRVMAVSDLFSGFDCLRTKLKRKRAGRLTSTECCSSISS